TGTTSAGNPVHESQLTLPVVLAAAASLRADGYRVTLSRTVDTSVARLGPGDVTQSGLLSLAGEHTDTQARVTCANRSGAAVLVSVHFNAFSRPDRPGLVDRLRQRPRLQRLQPPARPTRRRRRGRGAG